MSAMSRRKGAGHEREVVNILKASWPCVRPQSGSGCETRGGDIPLGNWLIECKRRATIAIYPWWDQGDGGVRPERQEAPLSSSAPTSEKTL